MTNEELVESVQRYNEALVPIFELAWRNLLDDALTSGLPNKVERAGIMHRNLRAEFRSFCDEMDPVVRLIEQPDGLDYLLIDVGDGRFIMLRFGHYSNNRVRRNFSEQQRSIQGQQVMEFCKESEAEETIPATVGYTVEDDYTEAGLPAWWMGRLVLLRECLSETEFVHDIAVFKKFECGTADRILAPQARRFRSRKRHDISRIAERLRKVG